MRKIILGGIIVAGLSLFLGMNFHQVKKEANRRFDSYKTQASSIMTTFGKMSFIDKGCGEPILSIHGICGGYDQGLETLENGDGSRRIIAPSRFGYPGTDMPEDATIDDQCYAYCQLLDYLKIDKTYILATSAGGISAIKMALLHPERVKGLILYCSGYPSLTPPQKEISFAGPPAFFCNDFAMWLISPLFPPIMGMPQSVIKTIIPMKDRKAGILFDGKVTNTDAINHYEKYDISALHVPVLIFHSKDDKLASDLDTIEQWSKKIQDCEIHLFNNGGHLMNGNDNLIANYLDEFIERTK